MNEEQSPKAVHHVRAEWIQVENPNDANEQADGDQDFENIHRQRSSHSNNSAQPTPATIEPVAIHCPFLPLVQTAMNAVPATATMHVVYA